MRPPSLSSHQRVLRLATSLLCFGLGRVLSFSTSSLPSNLLLNTPPLLRGLREIIDRYDIILVDQFGVIHNGNHPLPGSIEALAELERLGKKIVILSNTSARSQHAIERFQKLGFSSNSLAGFRTSGEAAFLHIKEKYVGKKCAMVSWGGGSNFAKSFIDDMKREAGVTLAPIEEADFALFHGSQAILSCGDNDPFKGEIPISLYETGTIDAPLEYFLTCAAQRRIPAVVANRDFTAVTLAGFRFMPGIISDLFESRGGTNIASFGKPSAEFFLDAIRDARDVEGVVNDSKQKQDEYSRLYMQAERFKSKMTTEQNQSLERLLQQSMRRRVLHVGDSLEHDITGAHNAGIDSVLITNHGVHRQEFLDKVVPKRDMVSSSGGHIGDEMKLSCTQGQVGLELEAEASPLIRNVCDLCDRLGSPRPTFLMEEFVF